MTHSAASRPRRTLVSFGPRPRGGLRHVGVALVCAWLLGLGSAQAAAQSPQTLPGLDPTRDLTQFNLDLWTEREGLPQNFVSVLAQAPDGYLWMGGERGLVRFDGVRFTVFTPDNAPGLTSAWVTALWSDPDGTLWVGTGGGGLVRYREGAFTAFGADEGLASPRVTVILRDSRSRLWVGTEGGGLHVQEADRFRRVGTEDGLLSDVIVSLAEGPSGILWVGTAGGLNALANDNVQAFGPEQGVRETRISALLAEDDGTLWVGTSGGGLMEGRDGEFVEHRLDDRLTGAFVSSLHRDRQGALWIGTNGSGLFRHWEGDTSVLTTNDGLPSNLVWDVLEDREGNLWLGLNAAGLVRLQDGIFDTFGAPEGLSMDVALATLEASDGSLWVGTPGGGVNRIRDEQVTTFTTADGLGHDIVLTVAEDTDGSIWVGTVAGGVSRIRGDQVETFSEAEGLAGGQVTVTYIDGEGTLWLGTPGHGIQSWRPETGPERTWGVTDGLPNGFVTTMLEDARGRLWVGTRDGLARLDGDRIEAFGTQEGLPHSTINGLYADGDGSIWAATMGGLARLSDDGITGFGPDAGLPGTEIMGVIEDDLGYLWLSRNQGLLRVSRGELEEVARGERISVSTRSFGRSDGLRSAEANGGIHPATWKTADGSLWFPTMAGAVRVNPSEIERPVLSPVPVLESVLVMDRSLSPHAPLELDPDERTLEFHFSAPTFIGADQIQFRYRLEGFDEEWVSPRDRRAAFYTNLPPGDYRFRVQAAGHDGAWSETEAQVAVHLTPHLHERRGVQAAGLIFFLALAGAGYKARIRRMEERENELLAVVDERERTEAALRRSEERLLLALEAGHMGTWEWNLDTGEVAWSYGMEELFGPSPGTLDELRDRLLAQVHPRHTSRVMEAIVRVMNQEMTELNLDFAISVPERGARHIELRGRWVKEERDSARRVVGVAADVTALIQAQRALRMREEELRQAQKMEAVGRLAGGIAHDFNNLLSVIGGNSRLALHTLEEDHPAREELTEIRHAGDRAATLTQQLLAFSRKQVLQPRLLYLNDVVRSVERMLGRLLRATIRLETRLTPELAPVEMDEGGLEQILVNLVLNAQDAMPDGGTVTISTSNHAGDDTAEEPVRRKPHVVLAVSDTGHGMDEETRRRAFEPFFTTKEVGKGTGLGLASVYGIVKQSGAQVEIESEVGKGTTFRIFVAQVDIAGSHREEFRSGSGAEGAEGHPPEKQPSGVSSARDPELGPREG